MQSFEDQCQDQCTRRLAFACGDAANHPRGKRESVSFEISDFPECARFDCKSTLLASGGDISDSAEAAVVLEGCITDWFFNDPEPEYECNDEIDEIILPSPFSATGGRGARFNSAESSSSSSSFSFGTENDPGTNTKMKGSTALVEASPYAYLAPVVDVAVVGVRRSGLNMGLHSWMLLDPMPARLKLLHACNQ
jgi:hypothetical protein